jgi:transcriptional regulator with XRE-family HTH domain
MRNVVKELRQRLNLSQSKFAKVAGFNSIQQVSNLENDRQNVGLGLIKKMVDSLNESGHRATLTVSISVDDEDILLC